MGDHIYMKELSLKKFQNMFRSSMDGFVKKISLSILVAGLDLFLQITEVMMYGNVLLMAKESLH